MRRGHEPCLIVVKCKNFPETSLLAALAASGIVFGLNFSLRLKLAEHPPMIRAVGLLVGACLLFATVHDVRSAALPGQSLNDVVNVARQINQIVPPNWVLVADEPFYFGLLDHPHFASADLNLLMVATGQYTGTQAWDTIAPDALVFSAARPPAHTTELDRYIQARQIVFTACWQTASYGRIELWMRDPPAPTSPDTNRCPFMPN